MSVRCWPTRPGSDTIRRAITASGFSLAGSPNHQIVAIDPETGIRRWARLAELGIGAVVPLALGGFVGTERRVPLPVLSQAYYTNDLELAVPNAVSADLGELVGYFMGDGSLHAKGIRLCIAEDDRDVVERLALLVRRLFRVTPVATLREGYLELAVNSTRLAEWWHVAGFAKGLPDAGHRGKGWTPHVPAALRECNCPRTYAAFLRGLFEADGTVAEGVPSLSTASARFADEVRAMLLALGLLTTTRQTTSGFGGSIFQVRLRNLAYASRFLGSVGFIGSRKARRLCVGDSANTGKRDRIYLPRRQWRELIPVSDPRRSLILQSLRRYGSVPRSLADALHVDYPDTRLKRALADFYESVCDVADEPSGGEYRLSVDSEASVVASGFMVR